MSDITKYTIFTIFLSLFGVGMFFLGFKSNRQIEPSPIEFIRDTTFIRDTFLVEKPIYVERKVVDSILIPITDTVTVSDTLYLIAEREALTWEDSLCRVYASGYKPQVDSVTHFLEKEYIYTTKEVKMYPRWSIGVGAGVSMVPVQGAIELKPSISVGVSYNILSWEFREKGKRYFF